MSVQAILILCTQALLVKSALGQCTSRAAVAAAPGLSAPALAYDGIAYPAAYGLGIGCGRGLPYDGFYAPAMEFTATSSGALPVSSASAMAPVGISVASDNVYEGALAVAGELPFVGTVAMNGVVPSAGAGAVNHACGNGRNAMISDNAAFIPAAGLAPLASYAPGVVYAAYAGRGCGCAL